MTITRLSIAQFRNFPQTVHDFDPKFQLIVGNNGTGKTSLLEAIYFCAYGKSFRSHQRKPLVAHGSGFFQACCQIQTQDAVKTIKRHYQVYGSSQCLIDDEKPNNHSLAARLCPLVLLDTNTHRLLVSQTKWRRDWINFCSFYRFKDFGRLMAGYQKTLEQRNRLLKQGTQTPLDELDHWTTQLLTYAEQVSAHQAQAVETVNQKLSEHSQSIVHNQGRLSLRFHPGHPETQTLAEALNLARSKELALGYTIAGPHKADFTCWDQNEHSVFNNYSQGQLKRVAYCLKLMQCLLINEENPEPAVMLLDDLGAEIDSEGQAIVLDTLKNLGCQTIVTALPNQHPGDCSQAIYLSS